MSQGQPLVAGNWKMNGLKASAAELAKVIEGAAGLSRNVDLLVCPPATLVLAFATHAHGSDVAIGGQDCHPEPSGAFTGDIAAEMLADAGATAVIVGHSERRGYHHETDAQVRAKAQAAWRASLTAIVCVGETRDERIGGRTLDGGRHAARRLGAGGRDGEKPRHRLRTGLGDRKRADADAGRRRGGARIHPPTAERALRNGRAGRPPSLWRLGQAVERRRADGGRNVDGALVGGASLKADDFLGDCAGLRVNAPVIRTA